MAAPYARSSPTATGNVGKPVFCCFSGRRRCQAILNKGFMAPSGPYSCYKVEVTIF